MNHLVKGSSIPSTHEVQHGVNVKQINLLNIFAEKIHEIRRQILYLNISYMFRMYIK